MDSSVVFFGAYVLTMSAMGQEPSIRDVENHLAWHGVDFAYSELEEFFDVVVARSLYNCLKTSTVSVTGHEDVEDPSNLVEVAHLVVSTDEGSSVWGVDTENGENRLFDASVHSKTTFPDSEIPADFTGSLLCHEEDVEEKSGEHELVYI